MHYEGSIFRPPNEADSILLQVTVGCSHNACSFCGMYREKRFHAKSWTQVAADLFEAAGTSRGVERVFLCDGDALALPQEELVRVLDGIALHLPWVTRVACYASARTIAGKSDEDLAELRARNLRLFHFGLESGDDRTLTQVKKYGDAKFHVEQLRRARRAGMKHFVTVLLGLAGEGRSQEHAQATAAVLSTMEPEYVGALCLMLIPGTPLHEEAEAGCFQPASSDTMLRELRTLVAETTMRGLFYANHASNPLPLRARLPKDRAGTLALIDACLRGEVPRRPEWLRAY